MSYARSGLQGVGIAIPNPSVDLHPQDISIDSIFDPFSNYTPTPFVAPATGSGLLNPFTNTTSSTTPLNPATALAAAKSISWEMVAGIAAVAWLLTRKR